MNHTMNEHEARYVAEARTALAERRDLSSHERQVIEGEIAMYERGEIRTDSYESFEARLDRLRDHYP